MDISQILATYNVTGSLVKEKSGMRRGGGEPEPNKYFIRHSEAIQHIMNHRSNHIRMHMTLRSNCMRMHTTLRLTCIRMHF